MCKNLNKKCPKCGSDDVVLTKQYKGFVSCNNCGYKINLVRTPEDKWNEKIVKTEPKCKACGDTGEICVLASEEGIIFTPCDCKSRYSIGDGLHTKEENRQTLIEAIIKYSKPKSYPVSDLEEFYDYIPSFIKYPARELNELATRFENEKETKEDIERLIGLLKIDNLAIDIAIHSGIHPITGGKWDNNDRMIWHRYNHLTDRNTRMIAHLMSMLEVLKKPAYKSRYEDPEDSLFVG